MERNKSRCDMRDKKRKWEEELPALTGSRRRSSVSLRAVLGFSCMSSLHSVSEAGGDSARSGKSSLVLGPRKRILSRRFSMVNTAHLGFTLTWWTATLQGHRTHICLFFFCLVTKCTNGHGALHELISQFKYPTMGHACNIWSFISNTRHSFYHERTMR